MFPTRPVRVCQAFKRPLRQRSGVTPEELGVAAAPLSLPETDDNDSDPKTNQDDPRNEKRPSARQENGEQSRAAE